MDNPPPTPPPAEFPPRGQYQGYAPIPPQKGWFGRNCFWFVPAGCLGLLALIAVFVGVLGFFVLGVLKATDPYKEGLARAKADARVVELLGLPVEDSWYASGQVTTAGTTGNANLRIPIAGPKGKATVSVIGQKTDGKWQYTSLEVVPEKGGETINLLDTGG